MNGVGDLLRARLAREAWKWAGQDRSAARAVCEPFVRGILQEEGVAATDEALESYTDGFCRRVTEFKKSLAEIEALNMEPHRTFMVHLALGRNKRPCK